MSKDTIFIEKVVTVQTQVLIKYEKGNLKARERGKRLACELTASPIPLVGVGVTATAGRSWTVSKRDVKARELGLEILHQQRLAKPVKGRMHAYNTQQGGAKRESDQG